MLIRNIGNTTHIFKAQNPNSKSTSTVSDSESLKSTVDQAVIIYAPRQ
jgi:hypothetical protein